MEETSLPRLVLEDADEATLGRLTADFKDYPVYYDG
jgi:hypothetical protein